MSRQITAVPAQRSSLPLLQIRRRLIIGALCATSAIGIASGIAWALPDPAPASIPARSEAAISLAQILVTDFVEGRDTTVPAAEGVRTDFSRSNGGALPDARITFAGSRQTYVGDTATPAIVERVAFHVAYTSGESTQVLEISVPMRQHGEGWIASAAPSVSPVHLAAPGPALDYSELYVGGGDANELATLPYGPAVKEQVNRWAKAFAEGGVASPELFNVTQDKNAEARYDGLGGWTATDVQIRSFTAGANSSQERIAQFGGTWLTVRVALVLVPPGANGPSLSTEYDLLLEPEMNPAQPPVTAWGPAGVGPTSALTDYVNNTNG